MKKIFTLVMLSLFALLGAKAVEFDANTKYRFVCNYYSSGSLVLGSQHGQTAYVWYDTGNTLHEDSWWYIQKAGAGYRIKNAKTGEYLSYTTNRIDGVCKGIELTTAANGKNVQWTINQSGEYFYIASASNPSQWFNLRVYDGTNLLGTYDENTMGYNELFSIIDETGKDLGGGASSGGGSGDNGNTGTLANGAVWENTGLAAPVVYTTDRSNPVLYYIKNVRSGMLAYVNGYSLYETTNENEASQFYFVQANSGVNIYTSDGYYVAVEDYYMMQDMPIGVQYGSTSVGQNNWQIGYYNDYETNCSGYTIGKAGSTSTLLENYWNDYDKNTYHFLGYYSVDGGSTFVFASSDDRHKDYLTEKGITIGGGGSGGGGGGGQTGGKNALSDYLATLLFNGKELPYDAAGSQYLVPLSATLRGGDDATIAVSATWQSAYASGYSLRVANQTPDAETGSVTIPAVSCEEPYKIAVVEDASGNEVAQATLQFTFLPVVEINVESTNRDYYITGTLRVTDPDIAVYDSAIIAAFKYRGASAMNYPKKSYAIKLRDADGNSVDRKFFNLRNDNNWILDAMAIDGACMRNRVSTDLWNDFATAPYHKTLENKARTGTRGRFVEVLLNGNYHGLYCMTEKMDRKQLKLMKYAPKTDTTEEQIHGSLYKSTDWTYETFMGHEQNSSYYPGTAPAAYDNSARRETWRGYEIKYPDYETEPIDWAPLWNAINFVATSSQDDFDNNFGKYFDRPVVDDYFLFIELMLASDNHGKNMFFFNYDQAGATNAQKIGIAPWDMDGTWGGYWDGSRDYVSDPTRDFVSFIWATEHGIITFYDKLAKSSYLRWSDVLKERYAQIRPQWFNPANLAKRFTDYAELFAESGADLREQGKWGVLHNDIQGDVAYITNWITRRVAMLDDKYGYDPWTGITDLTQRDTRIGISGGRGEIYISSDAAGIPVAIYTAAGRLVRQVQTTGYVTSVTGLQPGIYVAAGKKVVVK